MAIGNLEAESSVSSAGGRFIDEWPSRISVAVERVETPCYVSAWKRVAAAVSRLASIDTSVPLKLWLSFKTHPLVPLAARWLQAGRGVEVVSESELLTVRSLGATPDQILVNGVAKQCWLPRHPILGLRVHFDSPSELDALLPIAVANQWRVGIRCHVPGECDARETGVARRGRLSSAVETRFSQGHCAVVWFDDREVPVVARERAAEPVGSRVGN